MLFISSSAAALSSASRAGLRELVATEGNCSFCSPLSLWPGRWREVLDFDYVADFHVNIYHNFVYQCWWDLKRFLPDAAVIHRFQFVVSHKYDSATVVLSLLYQCLETHYPPVLLTDWNWISLDRAKRHMIHQFAHIQHNWFPLLLILRSFDSRFLDLIGREPSISFCQICYL